MRNFIYILTLCVILIPLNISAHWVEPLVLKINPNGSTNDDNIRIELKDPASSDPYDRYVYIYIKPQYVAHAELHYIKNANSGSSYSKDNIYITTRLITQKRSNHDVICFTASIKALENIKVLLTKISDNEYEPELELTFEEIVRVLPAKK